MATTMKLLRPRLNIGHRLALALNYIEDQIDHLVIWKPSHWYGSIFRRLVMGFLAIFVVMIIATLGCLVLALMGLTALAIIITASWLYHYQIVWFTIFLGMIVAVWVGYYFDPQRESKRWFSRDSDRV